MLLHGQNAVLVMSTWPQNFYQCLPYLKIMNTQVKIEIMFAQIFAFFGAKIGGLCITY
jgi:hypothetical protein